MKFLISIIFLLLVSTGCASTQGLTYRVLSEPTGAKVDVDGVSMGNTPTEITLYCTKQWVGVLNAPDGWSYTYGWSYTSGKFTVSAFPPIGAKGESQTKQVDPCQWKGQNKPELHFNLNLRTVAPVQQIEISTQEGNSDNDYKESVEALKTLRNKGIITEEEYKEKVLQLIKQSQLALHYNIYYYN